MFEAILLYVFPLDLSFVNLYVVFQIRLKKTLLCGLLLDLDFLVVLHSSRQLDTRTYKLQKKIVGHLLN
jgi:hypothetical protein